MRIIICDDDPTQRDLARACLEVSAVQHEFTEFELGQDALDHLRSHDADLLFLDMGLPDIERLEVLTIGADDYITKPFEPIELMTRVEVTYIYQ